MPPAVVSEVRPKLLVNVNLPLPPTVFLITWIDPARDAARVFVMVHVVVSPAITTMAVGIPSVHVALVWVQPAGTVSLRL